MRVAIIGAGALGGALARRLSRQADQVTVISRRPVDLPGLWIRGDAVSGDGLRKAVRGSEVVVFAAAGESRKEASELASFGARNAAVAAEDAGARLVVLGPAGGSARRQHPLHRAHHEGVAQARREGLALRVVRLPLLFGLNDHLLSPWLDRAARGEPVRMPRNRAVFRPLWTGDAARLVERAMADDPDWPGDVEVKGPTLHTLQELAIAACASLGRRPSTLPRLGGPFRWELAEEHGGERDDWDSLRLGERCTVSEWLAAAGTRS